MLLSEVKLIAENLMIQHGLKQRTVLGEEALTESLIQLQNLKYSTNVK